MVIQDREWRAMVEYKYKYLQDRTKYHCLRSEYYLVRGKKSTKRIIKYKLYMGEEFRVYRVTSNLALERTRFLSSLNLANVNTLEYLTRSKIATDHEPRELPFLVS
uniref:Uncharacterized protein n=1 Tax=Cacopsylla melanoneura TaxID=428564 RepID=A0A8D8R5V2_9HEMI